MRRRRFSLMILAAVFVWLSIGYTKTDLVIDFLDVGDGDAIMLRSGSLEVLIDAGPDRSVMAGLGDSLPIFDRHIEAVILTHPHSDHVAGLIHVLQRYDVGHVYVTDAGAGETWKAVEEAIVKKGIPISHIYSGQVIDLGDVILSVLWPPAGFVSPSDDPNDYSAVLSVSPKDQPSQTWALLTGDATPLVERRLLNRGSLSPVRVLKVAHHGSRFSTTADFVGSVQPEWSVISTGSRFSNHPAWIVLERLRSVGAEIWRTDRDGHVRFEFNDEQADVSHGWCASWPPLVP